MNTRRLALLGAVGCLAGCAAFDTKVEDAFAALGISASDVVMFFDFVKGAAEIAAIADPALAPIINVALAAVAPAIAAIEAGIATTADVATVIRQSVSLQNQVGAQIKVIPATGRSTAYFLPGRGVSPGLPIRP